jgi:hypothetical protein
MNKKKTFLWFSLAVVVVFGFYGAGNSTCPPVPVPDACGPVPTSCILYDACGNNSGFTLEVFPEGGLWPILRNGKYQWRYKINGNIIGIKSIATLAPHCCPANNYSTGGTAIYQPGAGDLLTKFGVGNFQDWVVMLSTDTGTTPPGYYFYSEKLVPTQRTSLQVKTSTATYYCPAIAGPSCPNELTTIAASTFERIQMDNGDDVCLSKNPNFPCKIAVDCISGNELLSLPIDQVLQANFQLPGTEGSGLFEPIFYAGVPEQACPLVFLRSCVGCENSTWVCSGGRCYYR